MSDIPDAWITWAIWFVIVLPFVIVFYIIIRRIRNGMRHEDEPVDPDRTSFL